MLGYLLNPSIGAAIYNFSHTLIVPVVLSIAAYCAQRPLMLAIAIILVAHVAFARSLGFGLKYPTSFKDTHLQHVP